MYAPRVRQGLHVPRGVTGILAALLASVIVVVAWAAVSVRTTSNESSYSVLDAPGAESIRSVAYAVPGDSADRILVRNVDRGSTRFVASFPVAFGVHLRGSASPAGDQIAVLHVESPGAPVRLTLVSLESGAEREIEGSFQYLSAVAWANDGSQFAVTGADPAGSGAPAVLNVDARSGAVVLAGAFPGALDVAPVGYSLDGQRLFIVVVDQAGSTLWERRGDALTRVATLSAGPTRDWALSADGARLAFIERLGVGERSYAARTLVIATGKVKEAVSSGDQLGAVWRPGAAQPEFGGPDGTLQLSDPTGGAYLLPLQWSPDGKTLAATVYTPMRDGAGEPAEDLEVMTPEGRIRLTDEPGARFLGWVRND